MRGNRKLLLIAVAAVALGIATAIWLRPTADPSPDPLPDLTLPDVDGRMRDLSEWKGKTLLINFWATWCPPCREEIPLLKDVQTKYAPRGLQVIGVAIDEVEDLKAYNREMQMNYPVLVADLGTFSVMNKYGNSSGSLPYTVILRPDGSVSERKLGAYREPELVQAIEKALPPTH